MHGRLLTVEIIQVQARFEVDIKELPEQIDTSTYSMFPRFPFSLITVCVLLGLVSCLDDL